MLIYRRHTNLQVMYMYYLYLVGVTLVYIRSMLLPITIIPLNNSHSNHTLDVCNKFKLHMCIYCLIFRQRSCACSQTCSKDHLYINMIKAHAYKHHISQVPRGILSMLLNPRIKIISVYTIFCWSLVWSLYASFSALESENCFILILHYILT